VRRATPLTLVLAAAVLAAGCMAPTPQQAQSAQADRLAARRLLDSFAACIRAKDASGLKPLVAPSLAPSELLPLCLNLEAASWLKSYDGYTMDAGPALDSVSWRSWETGSVQVPVTITNANGGTFTNSFTLTRGSAGWYIRSFTVDQPHPGDLIEPPPGVERQIRPTVQQLMGALKEGRFAEVWYALPDEPGAHMRTPKITFWQRLGGAEAPDVISLMGDLDIVRKLHLAAWPDTSGPLEMTWLGPGAVNVVYELPYALASDPQSQSLRVELTFVRKDEGWAFYTIRFYGAVIPFSE
jgi:hypothetical protein